MIHQAADYVFILHYIIQHMFYALMANKFVILSFFLVQTVNFSLH
jgi:hypothetical protein